MVIFNSLEDTIANAKDEHSPCHQMIGLVFIAANQTAGLVKLHVIILLNFPLRPLH